MVKTGRARTAHLVLFLCTFLALGSMAAFSATGASAGPLEGVSGPIEEAVGGPVKEVTETVTVPVQEVNETVAPPAKGDTESVTRPVQEVTETVVRPGKEVTEKVTQPVKEAVASSPATVPVKGATAATVHTATGAIGSSSASTGKSVGGVVREATGTATHTVQGPAGTIGTAVPPGLSSSGAGDPAGADRDPATDTGAPREGVRPDSASGPEGNVFESPSSDGSVRVPLPKWMAYIWPAIALTQPALADLLRRWDQVSLDLGLGSGSGDGPVVAGVHASGGRPEAPDASSSSSPFSKLPSAIAHAVFSDPPGETLAYLLIVAVMLIAVAAGVRHEVVVGRRQGRGH